MRIRWGKEKEIHAWHIAYAQRVFLSTFSLIKLLPPIICAYSSCWVASTLLRMLIKTLRLSKLCSAPPSTFPLGPVLEHVLKSPVLARILLKVSLARIPYPPYLITLTFHHSHHPAAIPDHPGLPSARVLSGQFSKEWPSPLSNFLPIHWPLSPAPCL